VLQCVAVYVVMLIHGVHTIALSLSLSCSLSISLPLFFPLSLSLSLSVSLSQSLSYVDETVSAQILHRDEDTRKEERWGAGVEYHFQEFNEPYAPS